MFSTINLSYLPSSWSPLLIPLNISCISWLIALKLIFLRSENEDG